MANVLQPVVRKPKRSNWYFYTVGAVGIALISGLCYFIFSVDLDPAVYELTAVKQIPISAVQNNRLSDVTQISIIPHSGPESIVYVNGTLYTGTENGNILRIRDSKVEVFHDLKQSDCDSVGPCGRPLGMRLSKNGENIFIVDALSGVYSLSLENGAVDKIFPLDSLFYPRFLDDLDVLPNGEIVISEATVKYSLQELDKEYLESRANGRLLLVNPKTGQWKVLADGLYFPNGVQLHRDGKSLLVAETSRFRVIRVPLDGKSPATVFVDGLPGFPDNIRLSPRGGYWIPVSNIRDGSLFSRALEWMAKSPLTRRVLYCINLLLPGLNMLKARSSMLLRVDEQGDIIEVWRDPQNKVLNVAEVCEAGEYLFTSSYFLPYVGKVKL